MEIKVNAGEFEKAAQSILTDFSKRTRENVSAAVDKTASQVVRKTKSDSPIKTGKYKAGWASRVTEQSNVRYEKTVYNKDRYRLTHLLEKGHGGPHPAGPHPHIVKDEEAQKLFEENLRKEIES
jgi:hypothetical protein